MTEIIFKHHGTIDKYVGDLIMAFWGAPLKDKRHNTHALLAALDMQKKIRTLDALMLDHDWPPLKIGIGVNSGLMSVGDMGSKFRRNYTVLGDAVNLASRVESLTKFYGVDIMATEFVVAHQKQIAFRLLDRVRVKGKKEGVFIYEVLSRITELTPAKKNEVTKSNLALDFYFKQKWEKARALFEELHLTYPEVKLYSLYLQRILEFEYAPPPTDWDGVYTLKTK